MYKSVHGKFCGGVIVFLCNVKFNSQDILSQLNVHEVSVGTTSGHRAS